MKSVCVLVTLIFFNKLIEVFGEYVDREGIEYLIKKWAPLIWLSPGEKYMPMAVEEFLENVDVADETGRIFTESTHRNIFLWPDSQKFYLVTRKALFDLKNNNTSFIYGRNPKQHAVPIYVVVNYCNPFISFHTSDANSIKKDINIVLGKTNSGLYFHVSYWTFYPYNEGKAVCFLGKVPTPLIFSRCFGHYKKLGNHIGDWEHMSLSFSGDTLPQKMFLSVHDGGAYYKYDAKGQNFRYVSQITGKSVIPNPKFPQFVRMQGGHPVLFSAYGSHGLWSSPGEYEYVKVPRLSDKNGYGVPWKTWNNIVFYHMGKSKIPDWMAFKGKWGNPKSNCLLFKKLGLCEFTDGPSGLMGRKKDFYCWPN